MESRRTVLNEFIAEQQWRFCYRRDLWIEVGEKKGDSEINGEGSRDAYTLSYVNRQPMGIFSMTQRTQTGLCNTWRVEMVGGIFKEGLCTPMVNSHWCVTEIKSIL